MSCFFGLIWTLLFTVLLLIQIYGISLFNGRLFQVNAGCSILYPMIMLSGIWHLDYRLMAILTVNIINKCSSIKHVQERQS